MMQKLSAIIKGTQGKQKIACDTLKHQKLFKTVSEPKFFDDPENENKNTGAFVFNADIGGLVGGVGSRKVVPS